jgi:uncharacterized protein YcbX
MLDSLCRESSRCPIAIVCTEAELARVSPGVLDLGYGRKHQTLRNLTMPSSKPTLLGVVEELWRYPVKSMIGERLSETEVRQRGMLGDRAYALRDTSDGKIATAKNPRKWPTLFEYRAALIGTATPGTEVPSACITLPGGSTLSTEQPDASRILSTALNREVRLEKIARGQQDAPAPNQETSEEYWLDMEGLEHRNTVTDFTLPEGTFFDTAYVHMLTTATLERMRELYPQGRFAVPRFRPNLVVRQADDFRGFVENAWVGAIVAIGGNVRLKIDLNCARCVMTTLAQGDLPRDPGILRTAAQHNQVNVGVYASVLQGGTIRRGDSLRLE